MIRFCQPVEICEWLPDVLQLIVVRYLPYDPDYERPETVCQVFWLEYDNVIYPYGEPRFPIMKIETPESPAEYCTGLSHNALIRLVNNLERRRPDLFAALMIWLTPVQLAWVNLHCGKRQFYICNEFLHSKVKNLLSPDEVSKWRILQGMPISRDDLVDYSEICTEYFLRQKKYEQIDPFYEWTGKEYLALGTPLEERLMNSKKIFWGDSLIQQAVKLGRHDIIRRLHRKLSPNIVCRQLLKMREYEYLDENIMCYDNILIHDFRITSETMGWLYKNRRSRIRFEHPRIHHDVVEAEWFIGQCEDLNCYARAALLGARLVYDTDGFTKYQNHRVNLAAFTEMISLTPNLTRSGKTPEYFYDLSSLPGNAPKELLDQLNPTWAVVLRAALLDYDVQEYIKIISKSDICQFGDKDIYDIIYLGKIPASRPYSNISEHDSQLAKRIPSYSPEVWNYLCGLRNLHDMQLSLSQLVRMGCKPQLVEAANIPEYQLIIQEYGIDKAALMFVSVGRFDLFKRSPELLKAEIFRVPIDETKSSTRVLKSLDIRKLKFIEKCARK